jgi:hypothetical protein
VSSESHGYQRVFEARVFEGGRKNGRAQAQEESMPCMLKDVEKGKSDLCWAGPLSPAGPTNLDRELSGQNRPNGVTQTGQEAARSTQG